VQSVHIIFQKVVMRRACVIGQGSIGQRHGAVLRGMDCAVTAVSRRAVEADAPHAVPSITAAFAINAYDYVVIASETAQHGADLDALDALDYHGPLLIEKPLFSAPHNISAARWPHLYVAYQLRFHPLLQRLKDEVEGAQILSASLAVGQHLDSWRAGRTGRDSYSRSRAAGGGALRDLSHELDLADWLLGPCTALTASGGRRADVTTDSDDAYALIARHQHCPQVMIQMNYLDHVGQRLITLITPERTLRADLMAGTLHINGKVASFAVDRDVPIRALHKAVLAGGGAACDLASAMRTMAVIAAAEVASAEQRWVSL
jgi:predicted dehydrogenase